MRSASRIPGCQRIALRLEAELKRDQQLLTLCERAYGPRTPSVEQKAFVRAVADSLEQRIRELREQLRQASALPGARNVAEHRAKIARKRQTHTLKAEDGWMVGLYEQ